MQSNRAAGTQSALIMAAEVGRFFQDLRRALRLSPVEAARQLATRPDILLALEAGDAQALPPWPETCRIVRTYTGLAGLDPRPVLFSLEQLHRLSPQKRKPKKPEYRFALPQLPVLSGLKQTLSNVRQRLPRLAWASTALDASPATPSVRPRQHRTARRVLFAISLPVALIVLITQTSVLEAAVSRLPPPMARLVRGAQEFIAVKMAPVRNGMRWIEVDDPRSRRGDKLQTAAQSD